MLTRKSNLGFSLIFFKDVFLFISHTPYGIEKFLNEATNVRSYLYRV